MTPIRTETEARAILEGLDAARIRKSLLDILHIVYGAGEPEGRTYNAAEAKNWEHETVACVAKELRALGLVPVGDANDEKCDECGEYFGGASDGYHGLCPSCADGEKVE